MIRENKKTLILSSLVTLLPIPIELALGRGTGALWLPACLLIAQWVCVIATAKDPKQKNQGKKVLRVVLWIMPILSLVLCGMDYILSKGMNFPIFSVFCLMFGLMFMAIGNYLPKCRQNYTIGIKVCWAYTSEENWNATHRFGGRVWFIGGLVIALGALLPQSLSIPLMFVSIFVLVLLPMVYSYRYYCWQKARGDELAPMPNLASTKFSVYTMVVVVVIAVFCLCVLFTGNLNYEFGEDSFTVEASYYDDLTVSYEDIEEIAYQEGNYPGTRLWGYGSFRLLMGTFQTGDVQYTRYTYYRPDSAVTMTVKGRLLVISGKNPIETRQLYETLVEKTG